MYHLSSNFFKDLSLNLAGFVIGLWSGLWCNLTHPPCPQHIQRYLQQAFKVRGTGCYEEERVTLIWNGSQRYFLLCHPS